MPGTMAADVGLISDKDGNFDLALGNGKFHGTWNLSTQSKLKHKLWLFSLQLM